MLNIFSDTWQILQPTILTRTILEVAKEISSLSADAAHLDFSPRVFLVGGFVRDTMLGCPSHDADIEVYGVRPEVLVALLEKKYPGQVLLLGKAFGIIKIHLDGGYELDVALPRRESKSGKGHTGFLVESDPWMTHAEAARRRDFTVNSLMADPLTGEVFDFFGGASDLQQSVLRVTDAATFPDDPLRVYRAFQFAARFHLQVEARTMALMREMVQRGDVAELSKERVTEELRKLFLKAERPSIGFEIARACGVITRDYPELDVLEKTPQEAEWHPEGDVWIHTMMVMDQAVRISRETERNFSDQEKLEVIIGSLCHDLGKPPTTAVMTGRVRSIGHEEAGEAPARELMKKWTFGGEIVHAALMSAREHLKPGMLYHSFKKGEMTDKQYRNAVRKIVMRIAPMSWRILIAVAEADYRGRSLPGVETEPFIYGQLFSRVAQELEDTHELEPLLQGRDLIELGVEPGPKMGLLMKQIEDARDKGEIKTKDEAIEYVRKANSS